MNDERCFHCKRPTVDEITWPGEAGEELCQECWEAECSRSWWKMLDAIVEPEPEKR